VINMTEKKNAQKILDEATTKDSKKTSKVKFSWKKISMTLAALLVISVVFNGMNLVGVSGFSGSSTDDISQKVEQFIESNYQGTEVVVKSISDNYGLYEIDLELTTPQGPQVVKSYVTKNGELLFPSAIPLTDAAAAPAPSQPTQPQPQQPSTDVAKTDKPKVELFVMSHCPFGTQAEKGILPVAELLGDKIEFDIKFVNYAMHGETEVLEQMNQVCIQDEQPDKWLEYLWCFLEAGDGEGCLAETNIDTTKLTACTTKLDTDNNILTLLADKATWSGGRFPQFPVHDAENKQYGVRGSPTLVINGVQASSGRDSASYLAAICAAFNNAPEECTQTVSSASPSSGFGLTNAPAASGSNAATCG
jgi:hypothetical protein